MTESQIQADIIEWLKSHGWMVRKFHISASKYSRSQDGTLDIWAIRGGKGVWIEVKTQTGRLRPKQISFIDELVSHGGNYLVARGIEDLRELA